MLLVKFICVFRNLTSDHAHVQGYIPPLSWYITVHDVCIAISSVTEKEQRKSPAFLWDSGVIRKCEHVLLLYDLKIELS